MANLATFGDLKTRLARRVGASHADDLTTLGEYGLEALRDVYRRFKWPSRRRVAHLLTSAAIDISIDAALRGDPNVTVPLAMDPTHVGWKVNKGWGNPGYEIESIAAPNVVLVRPWAEDDIAAPTEGKLYNDLLELPDDCAEVATEDIALLDSSGAPLAWKQRTEANAEYVFPRGQGRPGWITYGDHDLAPDGSVEHRNLRVGPNAPDAQYAVRVGYWRKYPTPSGDGDAILLPEDLRDLAVWGALYRAYSEPPWINDTQAASMKQLYEVELDIALRDSSKEGDAEMFVIDRFDEGSYY